MDELRKVLADAGWTQDLIDHYFVSNTLDERIPTISDTVISADRTFDSNYGDHVDFNISLQKPIGYDRVLLSK